MLTKRWQWVTDPITVHGNCGVNNQTVYTSICGSTCRNYISVGTYLFKKKLQASLSLSTAVLFSMESILMESVFQQAPCLNTKLCILEVCRDLLSPWWCLGTYDTRLPAAVLWINLLTWDVLDNTWCWDIPFPPDPLWINTWYRYGVSFLCKVFFR